MEKKVAFRDIIEALLDDEHPFPAKELRRFSDMTPTQITAILKKWPQVSDQRKHSLLEDLEELAESDTLTCFDDLARSLLSDPDPVVRTQAIRLLWESEDTKLIPIYLEMMKSDRDADTRAAATNALGQFVYLGELEKYSPETKKKIEDNLLEATISAKEPLIRRRALESLGYSSRDEVVPLINNAFHMTSPEWQASALFAMGRSCDSRWAKQVLGRLRAPNDDVRLEAVHAAGELELGTARSVLLDMLSDEENPDVRHEIVWSLAKIGGEGVRAKLEELLEREDEDDEWTDFIEEALDTLNFTEEMGAFDLLDIDPEDGFPEGTDE